MTFREDLTRALSIIARAEADLGTLSDGQRRDLLMDNTNWTRRHIRALVEEASDVPKPGDIVTSDHVVRATGMITRAEGHMGALSESERRELLTTFTFWPDWFIREVVAIIKLSASDRQ